MPLFELLNFGLEGDSHLGISFENEEHVCSFKERNDADRSSLDLEVPKHINEDAYLSKSVSFCEDLGVLSHIVS
jgi:hypothetical protein